jgi:hypothetical protein
MKKIKPFRYKVFELKELEYKLHILTWDWNKAKKYIYKYKNDYDLEDTYKNCNWFVTSKWENSFLYYKSWGQSTIIHEIVHAIQYFFQETYFIDFTTWYSEPLAYYISYYSIEAINFLEGYWHKKKNK